MRRLLRTPPALALALATPLAVAYLIARPPSADLATATYRGELFARAGFTLWDNAWYGGHYVPGYSLLAPPLAALTGERTLLVLSVLAAAGLFGLLAQGAFTPSAARVAAGTFALGAGVGLLSGRVAYDLGFALGLLALLALQRKRPATATALAALTSVASPVAGAFLALSALAHALPAPRLRSRPRRLRAELDRRALVTAAAALIPILIFAALFPEGGWEPFAPSAFWPALAGVLAIALLLPRLRHAPTRALTWGAWLYALVLIGSYALHTPVGSNSARLGQALAAPLVAGLLWERHRVALALLAPALLYWQLETSLHDASVLSGDPAVHSSYYAPLLRELRRRAAGLPLRVEVPQMSSHWEATYVPSGGAAGAGDGAILLARGWERQLDTRYAALFYARTLTPRAYRAWLAQNAVSYVALPDGQLDFSGAREGRLIASGLPYLREVWRGGHWRLFAVRGATPLAQPPATLSAVGTASFTLRAPRPGSFTVRVRFTPYWALLNGAGCVARGPSGWTQLSARRAGTIHVGIAFSPARIFEHGPRCRT